MCTYVIIQTWSDLRLPVQDDCAEHALMNSFSFSCLSWLPNALNCCGFQFQLPFWTAALHGDHSARWASMSHFKQQSHYLLSGWCMASACCICSSRVWAPVFASCAAFNRSFSWALFGCGPSECLWAKCSQCHSVATPPQVQSEVTCMGCRVSVEPLLMVTSELTGGDWQVSTLGG